MCAEFRPTHSEVYRRRGAFAGWPANYGLWAWGNEILSVFAVGRVGPKGDVHELDPEHPFKPCQARSLDGGVTWKAEAFHGHVPGGASLSADEHLEIELKVRPQIDRKADLAALIDPIDFLDAETTVLCARTGLAEDSLSWFYVSRFIDALTSSKLQASLICLIRCALQNHVAWRQPALSFKAAGWR